MGGDCEVVLGDGADGWMSVHGFIEENQLPCLLSYSRY